ncbi:hypothetical protein GCM10027345_06490 [Hymenobacter daeguensis]
MEGAPEFRNTRSRPVEVTPELRSEHFRAVEGAPELRSTLHRPADAAAGPYKRLIFRAEPIVTVCNRLGRKNARPPMPSFATFTY